MAQALITPDVLTWARERAQINIDALSHKLSTKAERIEAWERGESKPTFKQAQALAQKLHIPFGYLFLSAPPVEKLPIPDLRTIGDNEPDTISPAFRDLLNEVKRKQTWYREYAIKNGEEPFDYLGTFSLYDGIEEVAESIKKALSLKANERKKCSTKEAYLKLLTEKIEAVGVLVMRNSIVGSNTNRPLNVAEFRGFAMSDDYAPLIFLNSSDANSAKIFTLMHELAHLWIDQSGISSVDLHAVENNKIEKFCNAVSAEVLAPTNEFHTIWQQHRDLIDNTIATAQYFKVSTFVTARRAWDLKLITANTFFEFYKQESKRFEQQRQQKRSDSKGGGSYYANIRVRNGTKFSEAVVVSALEGKLPYREAAGFLNINSSSLRKFSQEMGVV